MDIESEVTKAFLAWVTVLSCMFCMIQFDGSQFGVLYYFICILLGIFSIHVIYE